MECNWKIIGKKMEFDEQDNDVIRLLTKLKESEGNYPVDMMTSRRQGYVKQIAALGIGAGAGVALKASSKGAGGSSIPPIAGTILETALIIAIVAEAGLVAVINRQKVLDFFRTISSQVVVEQIATSTPPDSAVPLVEPLLIGTVEPRLIDTVEPTEAVTETSTAVGTPSPDMMLVTDTEGDDVDTADALQANSTPDPNDNNGNHYGQTPIPVRTKASGGGSNPDRNDRENRNNSNPRR